MQCIPRATSEQLLPAPPAANINKQNGGETRHHLYKLGFASILFEEIHNRQRGYASKTKIYLFMKRYRVQKCKSACLI